MNAASSYKKNAKQRYNMKPQNSSNDVPSRPCNNCGQKGHRWTRAERQKHCPAYNHTCLKCGKLHHHESVCRAAQMRNQPQYNNTKPAINDAVFQDDTTDNFGFFNTNALFDGFPASESII